MTETTNKPKFSYAWKKRAEDLAQVKRYHRFKTMFYRTDLNIHCKRVQGISKALLRSIRVPTGFNVTKTYLIDEHHDDYELVLKGGDISLQTKLLMSEEEDFQLFHNEIAAAEVMAKFYPKSVRGYKYLDLLMHSIYKDCPEAQLHSYADKIDGYCEAIHEVLAGNLIFLEPVVNYEAQIFNDLRRQFPLIAEWFPEDRRRENKKNQDPNLFHWSVIDWGEFFKDGERGPEPHTPEIIGLKTGFLHYEMWKKITLETFPNGMELLTKQIEFHNK